MRNAQILQLGKCVKKLQPHLSGSNELTHGGPVPLHGIMHLGEHLFRVMAQCQTIT